MKRNIDDFNGMKDFIVSIVTVVAWVLIGAIVTIGYFTIETKGESVMLSFTSTIFTIISSLGIAATIGVYFWQKKDNSLQIEKKINAINMIMARKCKRVNWLSFNILKLIESIKNDNNRIKKHTGNDDNYHFIKITTSIKKQQYKFNIMDSYEYKVNVARFKDYTYTINSIDSSDLSKILYESATIDINLHYRLINLISIITELTHILNNLENFNTLVDQSIGDSFIDYMFDTATEETNNLKRVYFECTGNELLHMDWFIR